MQKNALPPGVPSSTVFMGEGTGEGTGEGLGEGTGEGFGDFLILIFLGGGGLVLLASARSTIIRVVSHRNRLMGSSERKDDDWREMQACPANITGRECSRHDKERN